MKHIIARHLTVKFGASRWLLGLSVGIAATLGAPLTAIGQTAAASSGGLEEIVVTANKLNA
jgi:hypothetical protein